MSERVSYAKKVWPDTGRNENEVVEGLHDVVSFLDSYQLSRLNNTTPSLQ